MHKVIAWEIYTGKEGVKTILSQVLKDKSDMYVLGAKHLIFSELKHFMPNFEKDRIKNKMKYICLHDTKKTLEAHKGPLVEGKALPKGFASDSVVWIFKDKVAIVLWKEKHSNAFLIYKKEVADSFRKWFKLIFETV